VLIITQSSIISTKQIHSQYEVSAFISSSAGRMSLVLPGLFIFCCITAQNHLCPSHRLMNREINRVTWRQTTVKNTVSLSVITVTKFNNKYSRNKQISTSLSSLTSMCQLQSKQERQCTYKVTLRRVLATKVVVEKQ
jgi:hypothetical protein